MKISIDDIELRKLQVDISEAPSRVQFQSRRSLKHRVGPLLAGAIRRDAAGHQGNWFGIPGTEYVTPLDKHVSHEMVTEDRLEAGIENKGAGRLANIIVNGSPRNPPAYDFMAGPRRVMPAIVEILTEVAEESVLGDDE